MNSELNKITLGGGCHWCTEAVFQSLKGVHKVEQGYASSAEAPDVFSEAVLIHFDSNIILLKTLVEIHLYTHKSTSNHSMREKYRSAVYAHTKMQEQQSKKIIEEFQPEFEHKLITKVLLFDRFKSSRAQIKNYYYSNPDKPFCETYIAPKLQLLLKQFSEYTKTNKMQPFIK